MQNINPPLTVQLCPSRQVIQQLISTKLPNNNPFSNTSSLNIQPQQSLTNYVFKVTNLDNTSQSLIIKFYQDNLTQFTDRLLENMLVCSLAQKNLYPTTFYCDSRCRIQQFIENGKVSTIEDFQNQRFKRIAEKIGQYAVNFCRVVQKFNQFSTNKKYRQICKMREIFKQTYEQKVKQAPQLVLQCQEQLLEIIQNPKIFGQLQSILKKHPMILNHNDINLSNIFILTNANNQIILDYEFSDINYLGFDLGNFFNEFITSYSTAFEINQKLEIPEEIKKQMIELYFKTIRPIIEVTKYEEMVYFIKVGRMLSHLFWMMIGLKQIDEVDIGLDMVYYIKRRFQEFHKIFEQILTLKKLQVPISDLKE